jgi:recombinational DNA repair ATPase RecF
LIGTLILAIVLLLCGCKQIEYVYVEPERQPITCIDDIHTPLDMAKCLNEYKTRY